MLELCTFGGLALRRPRETAQQHLKTQSKRVALLAYLALATPHGFHHRDTLLAVFRPASNDNAARQALRQAVHVLRSEYSSLTFNGLITSERQQQPRVAQR